MNAASFFFRLCRQRQVKSSLAAIPRQTAKQSVRHERKNFVSFASRRAQPETQLEVQTDHLPPRTVVTQTPSQAPIAEAEYPLKTVFCGNLAYGIEQDTIIQAFSEYGTVTSTRLPKTKDKSIRWGGYNKGFCFVTFASAEEAAAAIGALNGTDIGGRTIDVSHYKGQTDRALRDSRTAHRAAGVLGHELREAPSVRDEEHVRTQPCVTGTVTRVGTMSKTVSVTTNRRYLDDYTKTHHVREESVLVHDPQDILAEGDVVKYQRFTPDVYAARAARGKKNVKFIYKEMVTPFGTALEDRTPALFKSTTLTNKDVTPGKQRRGAAMA